MGACAQRATLAPCPRKLDLHFCHCSQRHNDGPILSPPPGVWIWVRPLLFEGLPRWLSGKRIYLPMQETQKMPIRSLGREDPLEKKMATHCNIAWKIPWTEEPGGLQGIAKSQTRLSEHTHTALWNSFFKNNLNSCLADNNKSRYFYF